MKNIALISKSDYVRRPLLDKIGAAIAKQITGDLAKFWRTPGTLATFGTLSEMTPDYSPIIIKDDIAMPGVLGAHWTDDGQAFAVVLATSDPNEVSLAVSHEALEMIVDPDGYSLQEGASPIAEQGKVRFITEICDPVQDRDCSYRIDGVMVSDFCTPSFFSAVQGAPYSFRRTIDGPLRLAGNGYMSWLTSDLHIWQGVGSGTSFTASDKGAYDPSLPIRFQTDQFGSKQTIAAIHNSGRRRRPFSMIRQIKASSRKSTLLSHIESLG